MGTKQVIKLQRGILFLLLSVAEKSRRELVSEPLDSIPAVRRRLPSATLGPAPRNCG
jgi:hypothetical protein